MAIAEAGRYCQVNVAANSAAQQYSTIPPVSEWRCNPNAAYLHYTDNETVNGVEFASIPEVAVPLIIGYIFRFGHSSHRGRRIWRGMCGSEKNLSVPQSDSSDSSRGFI